MAIHDKFYSGSSTSRHLQQGEHSWAEAVFQSGKPVLDAELIFNQEVSQYLQGLVWQNTMPSGWLSGPVKAAPYKDDFGFVAPSNPLFVSDSFFMKPRYALVGGMPVYVAWTDLAYQAFNRIQLDAAPLLGGAPPDVKRTDFVFLEVWQALVSTSPNASGTIQVSNLGLLADGDTISLGVNTLTARAAAPGVDEFLIDTTPALTAFRIRNAINNSPPNSFTDLQAAINPTATDTVIVQSVVSGAAGNLIVFSSASAGLTLLPGGGFLTGGVDTPNKPTQDTIYRNGNVLADPSVNLADDIKDPLVGVETAKRVQIQYRIRVTGQAEAVNFKTQPTGFENPNVLAQGGQAAPVATFPFVRANNTSVSGNSDATAYGIPDAGLWIAGNGTQAAATALGTVDGYVYAIPICFAFRRNDAYNAGAGNGFDPLSNTNGALPSTHPLFVNPIIGAIPVDTSDRPDGYFHDAIVEEDILDLRRHVFPGGIDLMAELSHQMQLLLDGSMATWAIDASDKQDLGAGSGDVSTKFLVCNEVGRSGAEGGVPPTSGDTTRGVSIANFDHVRRRFADQPVVERIVLAVLPTDLQAAEPGKYVAKVNPAYLGWLEADAIHIDLTNLNASGLGDYSDSSKTYSGGSGGSVFGFAPPGTQITNILGAWYDDGHYTTAVSQTVQFKTVTGMGTGHAILTLDANNSVVNTGGAGPDHVVVAPTASADNGSQRRIFIEVEVTYPLGSGTTDTPDVVLAPDATVYPEGALIEDDTTQRPTDWESLMPVRFREAKREVQMEYIANDIGSGIGSGTPIVDQIVSRNATTLYFPRRVYGSGATLTGVTDLVDTNPRDVDASSTEYGSSSRKVVLDITGPAPKVPLSGAGQTLCSITYFAQDPIPNYGGAGGGYQLAAYFRSVAPQTAGSKAGGSGLPATWQVYPVAMSKDLWTGTVGSGSVDVPYPYDVPMDQIPVNGNVPAGIYPGEWYFAATAQISVDDFNAETGLLNLHSMVPMAAVGDGTPIEFQSPDIDIEFRSHYKVTDPGSYRPTILAQPLSNVERHKVWVPFLAVSASDNALARKGEVLLVVLTRFARLDEENTIRFVDSGNTTCAGIYRTSGMLLLATTE